MSTGRMFVRAAVAAVASLALVTGGAVTTTAGAAEVPATERCAAEKQDVKQAKKKVKKAKKAKKKATKKVKKAKRTATKRDDVKAKKAKKKAVKKLKRAKKKLRVQKAERNHWCARAHDETSAQTELTRLVMVFEQIQTSGGGLDALPAELRDPLVSTVTEIIEMLRELEGQIPGAEPEVLTQIVTQLQALDPAALEGALDQLAAQFTAMPGSDVLADALMGGTLSGDLGDLGQVKTALEGLAAQLQAFDPAAGGLPLKGIEDALLAAAQQLQDNAPMLQDILAALTNLNGGTLPGDPGALLALLEALTELNGGVLPTDPAVLTDLIDGLLAGEVPTDVLPPEIGDVLDDAINEGLPGLEDLTDPIVDPILGDDPLGTVTDPILGDDPLGTVTDPILGDDPLGTVTDPILGDGGVLGGVTGDGGILGGVLRQS